MRNDRLLHALATVSLIALLPGVARGDSSPAYLVKDIHTTPNLGGALTGGRTAVLDGTVYFTATTNTTGDELWKSDGTPGGTVLVRDIRPGNSGSGATPHAAGGVVFLRASDSVHGTELWKSDGTGANTVFVKDIWPGGESNQDGLPNDFVSIGATTLFTAYDGVHGKELWRTDGTEAGTQLVKDIRPGSAASGPARLTLSGSTVFFYADDGVHGVELWKSDGTEAGTVMVADIRPGSATSVNLINPFQVFAGGLLLSADDGVRGFELWKSDGTAAGTVLVKDIRSGPTGAAPFYFVDFQGEVWFTADDGVNGRELWKTDGTTAGTVLAAEIVPGSQAATQLNIPVVQGGSLYVIATTTTLGRGLWRVDGPSAAQLLRDIWPGAAMFDCGFSDPPTVLTSAGGLVYYTRMECPSGLPAEITLWRTDGSGAGTFPIENVDLDSGGGPYGVLGASLLIRDESGALWRSDGTELGTTLVSDFGTMTSASSPSSGLSFGDSLYFAATSTVGRGLWKSDGTSSGTIALTGTTGATRLTAVDSSTFFFAASDGSHGTELWKSDGTAAGTSMVKDIRTGSSGALSDGRPFAAMNGKLYFMALESSFGRELWVSDGTEAGTTLVKDIRPGSLGSEVLGVTSLGGAVLFTADDGVHGRELWRSDGTEAGTQLLVDVRPGGSGSSSTPALLTEFNGYLYFSADDGTGTSLWRTDGTAAGTELFMVGTSFVSEFASTGGWLFFEGPNGIWKTDGTVAGTAYVPGTNGFYSHLRALNGKIVFAKSDAIQGLELGVSDGTATTLIDIWPGASSSLDLNVAGSTPRTFESIGDRLLFRANDGVHGEELWVSDGTVAGTRMLSDVAQPGGSLPSEIIAAGDFVYFSANQMGPGRELFALPRAALYDSDGDGLDDHAEATVHGTNPLVADSDGDGLADGAEVLVHDTDPLDADSDDDGSSDGQEVNVQGTDPLDPNEGGTAEVPAMGAMGVAMLGASLIAAGALAARRRRLS